MRDVIARHAPPEHVGIAIKVGERVSETVYFYSLPPEVITLAPEYRGYDYFISDDDEVVFVSPETHEIVGSIDYEGRAAADESGTSVAGAKPCPVER